MMQVPAKFRCLVPHQRRVRAQTLSMFGNFNFAWPVSLKAVLSVAAVATFSPGVSHCCGVRVFCACFATASHAQSLLCGTDCRVFVRVIVCLCIVCVGVTNR